MKISLYKIDFFHFDENKEFMTMYINDFKFKTWFYKMEICLWMLDKN